MILLYPLANQKALPVGYSNARSPSPFDSSVFGTTTSGIFLSDHALLTQTRATP